MSLLDIAMAVTPAKGGVSRPRYDDAEVVDLILAYVSGTITGSQVKAALSISKGTNAHTVLGGRALALARRGALVISRFEKKGTK